MTERASEESLDAALRGLPVRDLSPLQSRAIVNAARARLSQRPLHSSFERQQPKLLLALASMHALWAAARLLTQ